MMSFDFLLLLLLLLGFLRISLVLFVRICYDVLEFSISSVYTTRISIHNQMLPACVHNNITRKLGSAIRT